MTLSRLAVVGATFRTLKTSLRARLVALDQVEDAPTLQLLQAGHVQGVVRIETCSRTEWVISAKHARWASELLKGSLISRLAEPEVDLKAVHIYEGEEALDYLMRMTAGLDSLVEGEMAVSRQVLQAFNQAHLENKTDKLLRVVWKQLGQLLANKRQGALNRMGAGIEQLVYKYLIDRNIEYTRPLYLFGRGQIGKRILQYLQQHGYAQIKVFGRDSLLQWQEALRAVQLQQEGVLPVFLVASGAKEPWLFLTPRDASIDSCLCVDVGSPVQTVSAKGFELITLDHLLNQETLKLDVAEKLRLENAIDANKQELARRLNTPAELLENMYARKKEWLEQDMSVWLEQANQKELAQSLKKKIDHFTHHLMESAKEIKQTKV